MPLVATPTACPAEQKLKTSFDKTQVGRMLDWSEISGMPIASSRRKHLANAAKG